MVHKGRQATDKQAGRYPAIQAGIQVDRQTDVHTGRQAIRQAGR